VLCSSLILLTTSAGFQFFQFRKSKESLGSMFSKKIQRHGGRIFMKKSGKEPAALVGYMTPGSFNFL